MANERKTESLVRDQLRALGYYEPDNGVSVEEQKSEIAKVKSLLAKASKNARGNAGYPEFIISSKKDTGFLIVVECKPDAKKHESTNRDKPIDFAVDGVLHYSKHLAKHYTVVAVAVSGSTSSALRVSNFLVPAGSDEVKELVNEAGMPVEALVPFDDYYRLASFDPDVAKKRHSDLLAFSKELHELIWTKAKVSEEDKPLLVSGTLIALMNAPFMKTFASLPADDLQEAWLGAIKKELAKAEIPQAKKDTMLQPYSTIAVHPNLGHPAGNPATAIRPDRPPCTRFALAFVPAMTFAAIRRPAREGGDGAGNAWNTWPSAMPAMRCRTSGLIGDIRGGPASNKCRCRRSGRRRIHANPPGVVSNMAAIRKRRGRNGRTSRHGRDFPARPPDAGSRGAVFGPWGGFVHAVGS